MIEFGSVTILYVEDDETVRMVGSEAMREAGFDVMEAQTADEAILLLTDPDNVGLLVTDIRLPGTMDGIDLARETRKAYPMMPVLIVSGYASNTVERLRAFSPPVSFMNKPYSLIKIVVEIEALTNHL